jgi:hypothetical protein
MIPVTVDPYGQTNTAPLFGSGWQFNQLIARDRQEKYTIIRRIANESRSKQVDALIEVTENWVTPQDE